MQWKYKAIFSNQTRKKRRKSSLGFPSLAQACARITVKNIYSKMVKPRRIEARGVYFIFFPLLSLLRILCRMI